MGPTRTRISPLTFLDDESVGVVFPGLLLRGYELREPGLDMDMVEDSDIDVLLVSRPVAPGVHDGTVVLVRTLAAAGAAAGWRCTVLVPAGAGAALPAGVLGRTATLGGPLRDVAWRPLTMASLATAPLRGIRHYFFTPTAPVVSHLRRLHRLRPGPTVQTFCSTPADDVALAPLVFADRVIALSEHTRQRLVDEGVAPERVVCIPPAVTPLQATSEEGQRQTQHQAQRQTQHQAQHQAQRQAQRQALRQRVRHRLGLSARTPLVLYMGDYDSAGAARAVAATLPRVLDCTDAHAVLACRPKGADFRAVREQVRRALTSTATLRERVHLLSTIDWSADLAAGVDVALFPARRNPDKMDLPLALLESLVSGVPAVVAESGPLAELVRGGAAVGGNPRDPARLASETVRLLTDPDHHARAAAGARRWCSAEATPRTMMERHQALYAELLR